jgi:hypothetical protein
MYGIVNKAIGELITANYGATKWTAILKRSGIENDFFISNEAYDDSITYDLAQAVSEEMGISVSEVLIAFGRWWVVATTKEKYGALMASGGNNLKDFLINLPVFHNRVMFIYPKLTPPEFKVKDIRENSLTLHYISKRQGLQDFVRGLLEGLSIMFETPATIELVQSRNEGAAFEIFKISW